MALKAGYVGVLPDEADILSKNSDKLDKIPGIESIGSGLTLDENGDLSADGGGSSTLADLTDVVIDAQTLEDGQILQYDSTSQKWVNKTTAIPPVGSTVTPTDDIQTWLHCANVWCKPYTTINEVLADSTTLLALISNDNAADYMKRSTTWASSVCANSIAMTDIGANNYCADKLLSDSTWRVAICNSNYFESVLNVKVPIMTSNTTPSGIVSYSSLFQEGLEGFRAFDGNNGGSSGLGGWVSAAGTTSGWLQYKFPQATKIYKVKYTQRTSDSTGQNNFNHIKTGAIIASNDGTNFNNLCTIDDTSVPKTQETVDYNFPISTSYDYYRLRVDSIQYVGNTNCCCIRSLQFYGRASS